MKDCFPLFDVSTAVSGERPTEGQMFVTHREANVSALMVLIEPKPAIQTSLKTEQTEQDTHTKHTCLFLRGFRAEPVHKHCMCHAEKHNQTVGLERIPVEAAAAVAGDGVFVDGLVETFESECSPVKPQQRLPNKI